MRKIKEPDFNVKYPSKETAFVFRPENQIPFGHAIVGITYPFPDYCINRSARDKVENFEYVVKGSGEIFLDGRWQTATAGDIYILRGGEEHHYRAVRKEPWQKIWINYASSYSSAFLDAYNIRSGIYRVPDACPYFEQAFELSASTYASTSTCHTLADYVHKIISAVSLKESNEIASDEYRIRETLDSYVYKKANLGELAEGLHMSKSNVIRVFKKHYGITPYDYLLNAKLDTAKLLLGGTSMSVREIADRLHISDEHYFSTLFYNKVGMRPREFRDKTQFSNINEQ